MRRSATRPRPAALLAAMMLTGPASGEERPKILSAPSLCLIPGWSILVSRYGWTAYQGIRQDYETTDFVQRSRFPWDVTQHGPALGLTMHF